MVNANLDKTINNIEKYFSDNPYPKKDFYNAIADRDYLDISEVNPNGLVKIYTDINKELLLKYYDFLFFLDTEGIRYYMPIYMINLLKYHHEIGDTWVFDTLIQIIQGNGKKLLSTREQMETMHHFLSYLSDNCKICDHEKIEKCIESLTTEGIRGKGN